MRTTALRKNRKTLRGQVPAAHNGDGQLQTILDTAVEGIIVIDQRGIIKTFNRAATRMFGYEQREIIGKNIRTLMPPPVRGEHDRFMSRFLRTGKAKVIGIGREVVGIRKDRTTFPIDLAVGESIHNGQRSFTGILRDVSNRKRLERAILDVSEREQRRIGADLHDGLCQELAGIAFLVKTMHHKLKAGEAVAETAAGDIAAMLQEAVGHARALARGLQPVDTLPRGLSVALQNLAADTAELYSIRCQFSCPRPVEITDASAATHLYRIVQECVRAAVTYAHAKSIAITLARTRGNIELSVSDNATRPSPDHVFGGDMVRDMIHHRARVVGGRILIRRRKGGGVRVTCQIPEPKSA